MLVFNCNLLEVKEQWKQDTKDMYFEAVITEFLGIPCHDELFLVFTRKAQIWCPHTELYKFLLDILVNTDSSAENRTDLRLGQVVYL